jgi:endonuclease-3
MRRAKTDKSRAARLIQRRLDKAYPNARCALDHQNPLQLLVATILSAQCTDVRVNMVTPELFRRFPTAQSLAEADQDELERLIQSTGFYRNKAKNIRRCAQMLVEKHAGQVPRTMEELLELPGVARKTANVVLGNAFGVPGLVVDTHMIRLARRMGLTRQADPVKIERDLCEQLPAKDWTMFSHQMIHHGRRVCIARKPRCQECCVNDLCPKVGVKR